MYSLQLAGNELLLEATTGRVPPPMYPMGLPPPMLADNEVRQHTQCFVQARARGRSAGGLATCLTSVLLSRRHRMG